MAGRRAAATGVVTLEYALALPLFLLFVFLMLEAARAMFLWNTLQEVTRRAARGAAVTDFSCASAMAALRRNAVFRDSDGPLLTSGGITQDNVVIDYLWQDSAGVLQPLVGGLPASPAQNRTTCMVNPGGGACIQFVRVRVCSPDGCAPVPYEPLLPWLPLPAMTLPTAATVVRAESLGYRTGAAGAACS